jgi:hypothetical protein
MDDVGIYNYAFDQANLVLRLKQDEDLLDRMMNFTILATSSDPNI